MSIDFEDFKQMAQTTSTAFEKIDWTKATEELKEATKRMRDLEERAEFAALMTKALEEAAEKARDKAEIERISKILKDRTSNKFFNDQYVEWSSLSKNASSVRYSKPKEEKSSKPKTSLDDVVEW